MAPRASVAAGRDTALLAIAPQALPAFRTRRGKFGLRGSALKARDVAATHTLTGRCPSATEPEVESRDHTQPSSFSPRCLALDLEVDTGSGRIRRFGAVRADTRETLAFGRGPLDDALARLDSLAEGAAFVLGHNIVAFDLPHLAAAQPGLRLLQLPALDTLRLNPLAFPRNPYHHLVKHYQDGQLRRVQRNDPLLDAGLALELFEDQGNAMRAANARQPDLVLAWHWLTTHDPRDAGTDAWFSTMRRAVRPTDDAAADALARLLSGQACSSSVGEIVATAGAEGWALAYALAWLSVAGGNSVMPPWVMHQFPRAGELVRALRDRACESPACAWCRAYHDPERELARWFGFAAFRAEPADADGLPLQRAIVAAALRGEHVLAILPTGTGKSLCYQLPALSRYDRTGALTIVISPLVALMADQVAGLEAIGVSCCAALNGLLSMPERADVLEKVRLGDIGILLVAPEQLRSRGFRRAIEQREIGMWVLDEAHCLSKWGHDFRPDYRYVGRFIRERAGAGPMVPVLCLTATAKPDVIEDILAHFRERIGVALTLFNGGAQRSNLLFEVVPTSAPEKLGHIHQLLKSALPEDGTGGAIVFCATRRRAEEVADYLARTGLSAAYFHARLPPERKKEVQRAFIAGDVRVMAATNAFGMGIDKPDVRVVIHADIPGSLENYLQEAGRAGRDRALARCVLLFTPDDVERQFGMSARSRLTQPEIMAILKALRRLEARKHGTDGEVIATPGEILLEEEDAEFVRDSTTDDTRVRTAISWLEESELLTRDENAVQVFPSSLRVNSVEEAARKLAAHATLADEYRRVLLGLVRALIDAPASEGVSTDELMGITGLTIERLRKALYDLESLGIASNDTALTAFVHIGIERSSRNRLLRAAELEQALIDELRELAPELEVGDASVLNLRLATQRLKDAGHAAALPETVLRIIRGLGNDGRDEAGGAGSLSLRQLDPETVRLVLNRRWSALAHTAQLRRAGAERLLEHWLSRALPGQRGADLLLDTTLGNLLAALQADLALKAEVRDVSRLLDRALLWLHEMEVIRLNKGLAVFRPAMTLRLVRDRRAFSGTDYEPLRLHYAEQVVQIHIMAEYAERGLADVAEALHLAMDYFSLERDTFLQRWLPGQTRELGRQTTPESWHAIVESLGNPVQRRIVADNRERTNVLVLAGPGSGKTRVLVHRIAYLVRARREQPAGILALAYNRHAAVEIRRRLRMLIGSDADGVVVLTCHALAMRLAGVTFLGRSADVDDASFREVMMQAVALLKGEGLPPDEADAQRARLLRGFRWILVDEYQDVGREQYELIAALVGRTLDDEQGRLSLLAVADDDQNIYAFAGASVAYVRQFEADYAAKPVYLVENYRSTAHVIAAANAVIEPAAERMKTGHPIQLDRARLKDAPGGTWQALDPVGMGRVQVLPAGGDPITQAVVAMGELLRLAALDPEWRWTRVAVIAREWRYLQPVRTWCELNGVPAQMADETIPHFWRLRETQALIDWVRGSVSGLIDVAGVRAWIATRDGSRWWELLADAFEAYAQESGEADLPVHHFLEWLAEWGREARRRQFGVLLLTAHRAKGLEFEHVVVLDGSWHRSGRGEDAHAARRLYYVAMTRAMQTLTLARMGAAHPFIDALEGLPSVQHRQAVTAPAIAAELQQQRVVLSLKDVDIGFVGRKPAHSREHRAIAALRAGDALSLRVHGGAHELLTGDDTVVGRLARAYVIPQGMHCVTVRVAAIVVWTREWSQPEYAASLVVDRWEVVVPELLLAPSRAAETGGA